MDICVALYETMIRSYLLVLDSFCVALLVAR